MMATKLAKPTMRFCRLETVAECPMVFRQRWFGGEKTPGESVECASALTSDHLVCSVEHKGQTIHEHIRMMPFVRGWEERICLEADIADGSVTREQLVAAADKAEELATEASSRAIEAAKLVAEFDARQDKE